MKTPKQPSDFASYFRGVECLPQLSREHELALARRFKQAEDRRAADTLARAHLRLVVAMAFRYQRYGVPLPELVAEGNLGLVHAIEKFDPERGARLVTYAMHWIRSYILSYVIKAKSLVGGASRPWRSVMFFKVRRELARGLLLFGEGEAAARWTAERLGVTCDELALLAQRLETRDVSLESGTARDAGGERLIERLPAADDQEQRLFEEQVAGGVKAAVSSAIAELDPRERYIATHRLMVDSSEARRTRGSQLARELEGLLDSAQRVRRAPLCVAPRASGTIRKLPWHSSQIRRSKLSLPTRVSIGRYGERSNPRSDPKIPSLPPVHRFRSRPAVSYALVTLH